MKRLFLTLCFFLSTTLSIAQSADDEVDRLLNEGAYFELERVYPSMKPRVKDERIRLLADGLLGTYFNRPEEAIVAFDKLLKQYPDSFNNSYRGTITLFRGINQLVAGLYADAADDVAGYLAELRERDDNEPLMYSLEFISNCGDALRDNPAPQ